MFQLVLYNGDDKWTAPSNIDQLLETAVDLGQYGLHFEHMVIAENAYGKEWLAQVDNIIATLFLAEAHYDLAFLMEKLLSLYDTEPDRQALMLFINWFRQLAAYDKISSQDFAQIEEQYLTREEVKSMLIKALERERELIRQESFDSGKKEGIEQGIEQGIAAQRQTLLRLTHWRFALSAEAQQRYAHQFARIHNLDHLLQLLDQLLTLPTTAEFDEALLAYLPPSEGQR